MLIDINERVSKEKEKYVVDITCCTRIRAASVSRWKSSMIKEKSRNLRVGNLNVIILSKKFRIVFFIR